MLIDGCEFESNYAEVNGTRLHYVAGGQGDPVVLLPGWPRTWYQFHKVMPTLAQRYRVIAVDYRGMGDSAKPATGYDKKTMARDVYDLVRSLGHDKADIVGEDIGAMVAHSFAANHPEATKKLVLVEGAHPTDFFYSIPMLPQPGQGNGWWFAFNQVEALPQKLLAGRARLVIDNLIEQMAKRPEAIGEESRAIYAAAYDQRGAVRAGNGWYQTFAQDIADEKAYPKLTMPILALAGPSIGLHQVMLEGRATDIQFVEVPGVGHYLTEEGPTEFVRELSKFLG